MHLAARIAIGLAFGTAIIVGRTWFYEPPAAAPAALAAPETETDVATGAIAQRLSAAIRFRTVSHDNPAEDDLGQWRDFHSWLRANYPQLHRTARQDVVAGRTLVYTWRGSKPAAPAIVLMAHQDVVPVASGTERDWRYPPFAGLIRDSAVWGRGALDNKSSIIAMMDAVESLISEGFRPKRSIILIFGHDEETRGGSVRQATGLLQQRGIQTLLVLDEGMAVIDQPMLGGTAAIIGIAEKGYGTLVVTAHGSGGHASAPPPDTAVVTLARAVTAISDAPFPMRLEGPPEEMLRYLQPQLPLSFQVMVANEPLFRPLLMRAIRATPPTAALLHTTIAPTMVMGSPKENMLPRTATAYINYRFSPGQGPDEAITRARKAVGAIPVDLRWRFSPFGATRASSTSSEGWRLIAGIASAQFGARVAPGLLVGSTDSRFLSPIADDIYRFQPVRMNQSDYIAIHGTNEHISLRSLSGMRRFYRTLIRQGA